MGVATAGAAGLSNLGTGLGGAQSITSALAAGSVEKAQLKQQARFMEKAMAETKRRAWENANIMEESSKQMIGQQQVSRAGQGKIAGAGNDYLTYNDTIDKMAKNVTNMAQQVGYELHNQRFEIESTKIAARNAMTKAISSSINIAIGTASELVSEKKYSKEKTPDKGSSQSFIDGASSVFSKLYKKDK